MKMGKYCKALPLTMLRQFPDWTENAENTRKENDVPRALTDSDFLYLHENFVVTDGIFVDENVIFDRISPEWIEYCKRDLQFELPEYCRPEQSSQAT